MSENDGIDSDLTLQPIRPGAGIPTELSPESILFLLNLSKIVNEDFFHYLKRQEEPDVYRLRVLASHLLSIAEAVETCGLEVRAQPTIEDLGVDNDDRKLPSINAQTEADFQSAQTRISELVENLRNACLGDLMD